MCCCSDKIVNVITPPAEVTNVAASAAGATTDGLRPDPDQDRCQERAAADPVDPAHAPHYGGQDHQHGGRDQPGGTVRLTGASGPGEHQPDAQRHQDGGDHQVEDARAGDQLDPDDRSGDDAGQRPGDEHQGQVPAGLSLPPGSGTAPPASRLRCTAG